MDKPLSALLRSTYMSRKPIMFCVASPNGRHESLLTLLTNPGIVRKIVLYWITQSESFFLSGTLLNSPECIRI